MSPGVLGQTYHAVGAFFPRIAEASETGELQGVGVDLARQIATKLGHRLEIDLHPWARALQMIRKGQADLLIGPYWTEEREFFMDFSQAPFYTDQILLYVQRGAPIEWQGDLSVLVGRAVSVTRGWTYGTDFERIRSRLKLKQVNNLCYGFRQLQHGWVDVVPAMVRNARLCIDELELKNEVVGLQPAVEATQGYFGFARKPSLKVFRQRFEQELMRLFKNGTVARINHHYGLSYDREVATSNRSNGAGAVHP
ncbi:transporter substrate-binding domain-containing protein [Marinobacteraceae bacterium S3BR75-40.1]